MPKDNFLNFMTCGDIHPNALDHFCAWVEEVIAPILKLEKNLDKFPQCIADDIKRQVHELSTSVFQIRGYIKGRTLLPFPQVNRNLNYVVHVVYIFFGYFEVINFMQRNGPNLYHISTEISSWHINFYI